MGDDVHLQIAVRLQLGGVSHITGRRWADGAAHVREAMRLAEALGDNGVLARTLGPFITWTVLTQAELPEELEARAVALEPWTDHLRVLDHPLFDVSGVHWTDGDMVRFHQLTLELLERAERGGDYSSIPYLLRLLSVGDFHAGQAELGLDRLERAERLAHATGQQTALVNVHAARTTLYARLGRSEEAWRSGREGLALVERIGFRGAEPRIRMELGRMELSRRDPEAALAVLEPFGVRPGDDDRGWVWWKGSVYAEA
ncbi:MAG TPA: hypothetical protein VMV01_10220, partial [Planctomycetota bacterium]|nr:hypothetical protein [Planctomycetota bacterium]